MFHPNPLKAGDTIAILCPSTPTTREKVDLAESAMRRIGFNPKMYPSCYAYHGHLAGTDDIRLNDLHNAFSDTNIKGIVCLKGGSGSTRLLSKLDFEMIKNNPKPFIGYSDITALLVAINQHSDFITYHGPMATSEIFIDPEMQHDAYSIESFKSHLMTPNGYHGPLENPEGESMETLVPGKCEGFLTGGNLSLLVETLGSPYEVNTEDKILFIEDIGEDLYKIDKYLTALSLAGKFDDCVGIIFGTFTNCNAELKKSYGGYDLSLRTIIDEVVIPHQKPTLFNLRAGHNFPQPTLAIGAKLFMDSYEKKLIFL